MIIKASKRDFFWSYAAYILKFGINIFIFPIVLRALSSEEYGLWVTFSSIGIVVNLFDFGFSSTLIRNITYVWSGATDIRKNGYSPPNKGAQRDDALFVITYHTCRTIYLIIALAAALVSFSLGTIYIVYITKDISSIEFLIGWFIYGASISINLYYTYCTVSLRAVGAIHQSQKANVLGFLVQLVVSYAGLAVGGGIISLAVAGCLCGIVNRMASLIMLRKYQSIGEIIEKNKDQATFQRKKELFKILWYNAKRAGISSVASVVLSQSTTLISSAYLGVAVTGEYGLCLQLLNVINGLSQIQYQTNLPQLTQARLVDDHSFCKKTFSKSMVSFWVCFLSGCGAVLIFGNWGLTLIGSQTAISIPIFIIMTLFSFGETNYSLHASYISLSNKLPFVRSLIITSVIVVIFSFASIALRFGIIGLLCIRLFVGACYIYWKWPNEAKKQLGITSFEMIRLGGLQLLGKGNQQ